MKRTHGKEAVALAKKYKLGYVFAYDDHEIGHLAGSEEKCVPIDIAERVAEVKPWMIYVDYEEPRRCWWKPWTWFQKKQETTSDASDPAR